MDLRRKLYCHGCGLLDRLATTGGTVRIMQQHTGEHMWPPMTLYRKNLRVSVCVCALGTEHRRQNKWNYCWGLWSRWPDDHHRPTRFACKAHNIVYSSTARTKFMLWLWWEILFICRASSSICALFGSCQPTIDDYCLALARNRHERTAKKKLTSALQCISFKDENVFLNNPTGPVESAAFLRWNNILFLCWNNILSNNQTQNHNALFELHFVGFCSARPDNPNMLPAS